MRLSQQQLNNLPVYTKNQDFLGRVSGFEFDTETHQIINYKIGSSSLLRSLLGEQQQLIISYLDVISLTEEKMTVQDTVIKEDSTTLIASQQSKKILAEEPKFQTLNKFRAWN